MGEFVTVEEAAAWLGVEYSTVYNLVRRGEIPAGKIGRIYRIRQRDLEEYFERQKQAVATRARQSQPLADREVRCGGCGSRIVSELSIAGRCERCDQPICQACWMIRKVRTCKSHQAEAAQGAASASGGSSVTGKAVRLGEGPAPKETPDEAIRRLRREGRAVIERGRGVVEEEAFLRSFAQRFEGVERLTDPLTGRELILRDARVKHAVSGGSGGDGDVPGNRGSVFRIKTGGWGRPITQVVVEGRFCSHPEAIAQRGYDAEPIDAQELLAMLNETSASAQKDGAFHVVLMGSPTGFSPQAVEAARGARKGSRFRDERVGYALCDLAGETVVLDEADERLWPFWAVLDPPRHEAKVAECVEAIGGQLARSGSVTLDEAVAQCGGEGSWVEAAMRRIASRGAHDLDDIEGIGLVLSTRNA